MILSNIIWIQGQYNSVFTPWKLDLFYKYIKADKQPPGLSIKLK